MWLYPLIALLFSLSQLQADEIDITQPLRIHQLIPRERFSVTLPIEPALPKEFVALEDNSSEWIYWGPEEVLKAYLKDQNSLLVPILRFKLSPNIAQTKRGCLDESQFQNQFPKALGAVTSLHFGSWDEYPYCTISGKMQGKEFLMGYVGLNHLESGSVLLFNLITPKEASADSAALALWNTFFEKTKKLPEPLLFKAEGQEIHPGYTIVDVAGRTIKAVAEKRKSDQKILCAIIPDDQTVEFQFKKLHQTIMPATWHHGEPLLKIDGAYIVDKGWLHMSMSTSILIKEVEQFSSVPFLKRNVFFKNL